MYIMYIMKMDLIVDNLVYIILLLKMVFLCNDLFIMLFKYKRQQMQLNKKIKIEIFLR